MKALTVSKIGGNIAESPEKLDAFCKQFAASPSPKILVHGGGVLASEIQKKFGMVPNMIDGRRVTDAETLRITVMAYAGWCNKNIVATLRKYGCNAIGLAGCDASIIKAGKRAPLNGIDYGFVGDVTPGCVNTEVLETLLSAGLGSGLGSLHDPALLLLAQLVPGIVGDDNLQSAEGVTVEKEVGRDFLEGVGAVVCGGLLSAVDNAGVQGAVELSESNRGGGSAEVGDHAGHDRVGGNADLEALQILKALDLVLEEEVTEAFLTVADAAQGQADLLGLVQELLGQLAVGELPEMLLIDEGVGDGQKAGLVAAVLGQSESGDTAEVADVAAAEQVVEDLILGAENAAGLNVNQNGAAGQLFELCLEGLGHFADGGAFEGVDFRVGEGDGLVSGSGDSAQRKNHAQCHGECQNLFHLFSSITYFSAVLFCAAGLKRADVFPVHKRTSVLYYNSKFKSCP